MLAHPNTHPCLAGIQVPELDVSIPDSHKTKAIFRECYVHNLHDRVDIE